MYMYVENTSKMVPERASAALYSRTAPRRRGAALLEVVGWELCEVGSTVGRGAYMVVVVEVYLRLDLFFF